MKTLYLECNMGAAGDMLMAALTELMPDKDAFVKEVLGEHISSKLIEAKEAEWMQYRTQVTGWEIEEYLYKI